MNGSKLDRELEQTWHVIDVGVRAPGWLVDNVDADSFPLLLETLHGARQVAVLERMRPRVVPLHDETSKTVS